MKKPIEGKGGSVPGKAGQCGWLSDTYPTLWEYLSDTKWEDGSPREVATLMVLCEGGMLKVCLNDRAMGRSAWVSGDGLLLALACLDRSLAAGSVDWRVRAQAAGKKR